MVAVRPTGWGGAPVAAPPLAAIAQAAQRVRGTAVRTPLIPLHSYAASTNIYLKPEVLQPVGSFKIRGVYNWAANLSDEERQRGLSTTSAGNTAQALGYVARLFAVPARSLVPDWLPDNKRQAITAYGAELVTVPLEKMMSYMFEEGWREEPYSYLNPWGEPEMIAGHGTIGLEIIEDMPEVDTVFVPVGGGALVSGIASAMKATMPSVRVVGVQAEVNSALAAAFAASGPVWIEWQDTICEGASTPLIVDEMYPLLRELVDDVALVSEEAVKDAIRLLALRNKLVAEGAGAVSVAAALATPVEQRGTTVCVVSGGSIDTRLLASIIGGGD